MTTPTEHLTTPSVAMEPPDQDPSTVRTAGWQPTDPRGSVVAVVAVTVVFVLSGAVHIAAARLNGDEGWYALAAVNLLHGKALYRDVLFTQGPFAAYLEALWFAVFGAGIAQARGLALTLGVVTVALSCTTVTRRAGTLAGVLNGMLIVGNLALTYDLCTARTYPLTLALEAIAILAAASLDAPAGVPVLLLSSVAMVFTRLSMLPVPLCAVVLALHRAPTRRTLGWIAATLLATAVLVFSLHPDDRFWFDVLGFHREYYGFVPWRASNVYRYFIRGVVADQAAILVLFTSATVLFALRRRVNSPLTADLQALTPWLLFCLTAWVSTTAIHLSRPVAFPVFQASNVLFATVFVSVVGSRWAARTPDGTLAALAIVLPLTVFTMPFQDDVLHVGGDTGPGRLDDVSAYVRALGHGHGTVFTLAPEITVDTHLQGLPGWEMGEFSWFPRMTIPRARRLHAATPGTLAMDLTARRPDIVCLTDRGIHLLHDTPAMDTLQRTYVLRRSFPRYGQFDENLYVLQRRP